MAIDRATSHQIANEIISLLPDEEFRKHWPAALAAMVLFARNMSAEQTKSASDVGDLVEKNIQAMRGFVHHFHETCAAVSADIRAGNTTMLEHEIEAIVLAAKAKFTEEVLKSTSEQLSCINQEIRMHTGIEVRKALDFELQQFLAQKKSTIDATNAAMARLAAISHSADAAVARLEGAVETISRLDRERQLQKGFFRKLKELFFGEVLPEVPAEKTSLER